MVHYSEGFRAQVLELGGKNIPQKVRVIGYEGTQPAHFALINQTLSGRSIDQLGEFEQAIAFSHQEIYCPTIPPQARPKKGPI